MSSARHNSYSSHTRIMLEYIIVYPHAILRVCSVMCHNKLNNQLTQVNACVRASEYARVCECVFVCDA